MRRVTSLFLISLLAWGCGGLPTREPPSPRASNGLLLRYRFSPGHERRYLVGTSFSSRTLADSDKALTVEHSAELSQTVQKVSPSGAASIAAVIDKLSLTMSAPGQGIVTFDSAPDRDLSHCPSEMRGIAFLVGKKIELHQAPSGEILGIGGMAAIYRQALSELSFEERQPLERLLREMSHKPRGLLGLGVSFPRHPVRIGEQWSSDRGPFPILCGQLIYPCTYTLNDVSDGQAIIEFRGEVGQTDASADTPFQPLKTTSVQGMLSFDVEMGFLTRMRGESSSFLHVGGRKELRRRVTWDFSFQGERRPQQAKEV